MNARFAIGPRPPYAGPVLDNDRGRLIAAFAELQDAGYFTVLQLGTYGREGWFELGHVYDDPPKAVFTVHQMGDEHTFDASGNLGKPLPVFWRGDPDAVVAALERQGMTVASPEPYGTPEREGFAMVAPNEAPGPTHESVLLGHARRWADAHTPGPLMDLPPAVRAQNAVAFRQWLKETDPAFYERTEQDVLSRPLAEDWGYAHALSWVGDERHQAREAGILAEHSQANHGSAWTQAPQRDAIVEATVQARTDVGYFAVLDSGLVAHVNTLSYYDNDPRYLRPAPPVGTGVTLVVKYLDEENHIIHASAKPSAIAEARARRTR